MVAGYEAGASVDELAARFEVSNSPIRRILNAAGVQMRPTGRAPATAPDVDQLAADYRAGETLLSLSRAHGWDPKTIKKWLVRAGVDVDPRRRRSRAR